MNTQQKLHEPDDARKALLSILEDEKLAKEELQKSEERLRLSTELANVAVWEYDFKMNSMSRSKNHDRLYGLEWQTKWDLDTFTNAIHPDDREYSNGIIQKSVTAGGPNRYTFDFRVVHSDQSIHWLSVVGEVLERNSEGQGILVRGCLIDITQRKQAEEALRRSEAQLRENNITLIRLLTHRESPLKIQQIVSDEKTPLRILYLENDPNDIFILEELLNNSNIAYHLTHAEKREPYTNALANPDFDIIILDFHLSDIDGNEALQLAQHAAPEIPVIVFTGSSTEIDISRMMTAGAWNYVIKDHPNRLIAAINQAVERKRLLEEQLISEDVLRKNQERFQALIEHGADGIAMFDESGKILYSSPSTREILGYSVNEFEGRNIFDILHTEDQPLAKNQLGACIAKPETASNFIARIKHKDGSWRYIEMVITNQLSVISVGAIVCNYRDITGRKRAEEELEAQKHFISSVVDTSPAIIYVYDMVLNRNVYINSGMERMLGYSSKEIRDMEENVFADLLHPDDLPAIIELHSKIHSASDYDTLVVEYRMKNRQKEWRTLRSDERVFTRNTDGSVKQKIGIAIDITGRKLAEEALRSSEEKFSSAFHVGPAGMTITRISDGKFIDVNESFLRMFEFNRDEVIGRTSIEINMLSPEERAKLIKMQLETGGLNNCELMSLSKSGKIVNLLFSSKPIELMGEACHVTTMIDITERRRAEESLRKSEAHLEEAQRIAHLGSWEWIAETDTPTWSKELCAILEVDPVKPIPKMAEQDKLYTPDSMVRMRTAVEKTMRTGEPYEIELGRVCEDGSRKWLLARGELWYDENGNIKGLRGTALDITERKRAEEETKRINEDLRTINRIILTSASALDLDAILDKVMDEAVSVVGLEGGTICLINPDDTFDLAAERGASAGTIADLTKNKVKVGDCLCGNCAKECKPLILNSKEEVLDYATREVLRGEDIRFHAAFPFIVGKKCVGVLCVFTRTDLKPSKKNLKLLETIVAQTAIAIENARLYEEVKKYNIHLEKIVSERTAELQLANKELEAFSYSVSHDLRAPLRAIDGFSLALLEDYSKILDEQGKQFLQRVRNGATEMAQLVDDLLNLSRISRRELIPGRVDLSTIVRSITNKLAAEEPDRKVKFDIMENVFVSGDRNLLKIAMDNLINNAWKFTSKKKTAKIEFGVLEKEGKNVYYIKDNGVGFDMKYANKLFAPFQRLHKKEEFPGTGIGLATAKRILYKHGGTIWVESELGKGTVFYFTL